MPGKSAKTRKNVSREGETYNGVSLPSGMTAAVARAAVEEISRWEGDARLSLDRLGLLVLNRFGIPVAQFRQREPSLGTINLPLLVFELSELPLRQ